MHIELHLCALDPQMVQAWSRYFGATAHVSLHEGDILARRADAILSPANSFGFMDGGIDLAYSHTFGWHVQKRLQRAIWERHHGELLVGTAEIVETDHPRINYVIAAPTMRVPMILRETVNPYLAARAALLLIKHERFRDDPFAGETVASVVRTVAFPGMGTGVGKVGPNTCARQVRAAIEEVILDKGSFPQTWADAQSRHQLLYGDRFRDLQRE